MKTTPKAVGFCLAGGIATSATALSALAAIESLLDMPLSSDSCTSDTFLFFLASLVMLSLWHLMPRQQSVKLLISSINRNEGLSLYSNQLLGYSLNCARKVMLWQAPRKQVC